MYPQPPDPTRPGSPERTARYTHCTPPDAMTSEPAGNDLADALRHTLSQFSLRKHASNVVDGQSPSGRVLDAALLFAVAPGVAHVVGSSPLAEEARGLLGDGVVTGWRLHELPDTTTPLSALRPHLESRYYNLLDRHGFTSVEEATAAPDAGLLQLRNAGPRFVEALRAIVGEPDTRKMAVTRPADLQDAHQRRNHLLGRLRTAAAARYRELVDALARSSIPLAALDKIATALNNEPIPPADPTVTLLLETAGEQQILDHYLSTHQSDDADI